MRIKKSNWRQPKKKKKKKKTKIKKKTGKASDENSKIVLEATQNHLSVQDYGKGIPEEDLKRVTEAFYMVDKSRSRVKGSVGLGLALCQKIADIHGFQLEITSHLSKGTIISVLW